MAIFAAPTTSQAATISVGISVGIAPPPIPIYAQPDCPGPGYMWTPGYWAYDPEDGYFWVPGTWVVAPAPGLLWTPGYWGWGGTAFFWHAGYWGPHVGFYGGINYGFGYNGIGFVGGEWRGRDFFYNRSVVNIGRGHITNVYYRSVTNNFAVNRVSYNGGRGGINARPGREELAAEHDRHMEAMPIQHQHEMGAHRDRSQFSSVNHGTPGVAATGRPSEFRGAGVGQSTRAGGHGQPGGLPQHEHAAYERLFGLSQLQSGRRQSARHGRPPKRARLAGIEPAARRNTQRGIPLHTCRWIPLFYTIAEQNTFRWAGSKPRDLLPTGTIRTARFTAVIARGTCRRGA